MNRDLDSLARGPLAIAAALALALLAVWGLVATGNTQFIVPGPEQVGQTFFSSLKAHNFGAAREQLSENLQQAVSAEDLRELTERLEQTADGINQANGEQAIEQGETATAEVKLQLANGTERTVAVPLAREHGLWVITSLAPLEALSGP